MFLIHLDWVNIPVFVERDWSPVGYLSCWIVRRSGLEHPGTVENVDTNSPGAPEIRIIVKFSPEDILSSNLPRCMSSGSEALWQWQAPDWRMLETADLVRTMPPPPVM